MNSVFFSIIAPVYNVEKYLRKCIESILNQTNQNFEIILVNDGSTDKSGEICEQYQKKYPEKIRYYSHDNQGQYLTRKKGLDVANGDYFVFMDTDDELRNDALEKLENVIIYNLDVDVVIYKLNRIDQRSRLLKTNNETLYTKGYIDKEEMIKKLLSTTIFNSLCIKCIKCSLYRESENLETLGYKNINYSYIKHGEDLLQSIPFIMNARSLYYLPEDLYHYRVNENSVSHFADSNRYISLLTVKPILYTYLKMHNYDNDDNVKRFYQEYLNNIFETLQCEIASDLEYTDVVNIFDIIFNNEYVTNAKEYLNNSKLKFYKKIVLFLFYKKRYFILTKFSLVIQFLISKKNQIFLKLKKI